ncbi:TonB-dependent receptor, partial [Flavobacteriales bacterium]|nr:TonB-dependent receptor [Flavobacteriales bacterium]
FNLFINFSNIKSNYIKSDQAGVKNNKIEYVPEINLKTGLNFGYKRTNTSLQFSYISEQYSDASNAIMGNSSGIIGLIPKYNIVDFSFSYKLNKIKVETGINNLFDKEYFSRRAVGYPGPGIIPSPIRNYYLSLEIKI